MHTHKEPHTNVRAHTHTRTLPQSVSPDQSRPRLPGSTVSVCTRAYRSECNEYLHGHACVNSRVCVYVWKFVCVCVREVTLADPAVRWDGARWCLAVGCLRGDRADDAVYEVYWSDMHRSPTLIPISLSVPPPLPLLSISRRRVCTEPPRLCDSESPRPPAEGRARSLNRPTRPLEVSVVTYCPTAPTLNFLLFILSGCPASVGSTSGNRAEASPAKSEVFFSRRLERVSRSF